MNELGLMLVGCVARVTAFAALGALLYGAARRRGPAVGSSVALASLVGLVGVSALAASPGNTAQATSRRRLSAISPA